MFINSYNMLTIACIYTYSTYILRFWFFLPLWRTSNQSVSTLPQNMIVLHDRVPLCTPRGCREASVHWSMTSERLCHFHRTWWVQYSTYHFICPPLECPCCSKRIQHGVFQRPAPFPGTPPNRQFGKRNCSFVGVFLCWLPSSLHSRECRV